MVDFSVVAGYGVVLSPQEFQSIIAYRFPELTSEEVTEHMWDLPGGMPLTHAEKVLGVKIQIAGNSISGDNVFVLQAAAVSTQSVNDVDYKLVDVSSEVREQFPPLPARNLGSLQAPCPVRRLAH